MDITKAYFDSALKTALKTALKDFVTKDYLDNKLENFSASLYGNISATFATKKDLENTVGASEAKLVKLMNFQKSEIVQYVDKRISTSEEMLAGMILSSEEQLAAMTAIGFAEVHSDIKKFGHRLDVVEHRVEALSRV